ncbi:MAG: DUF4388 domain-containing protein [Fibrobacteres bacterium]|jgi:hypothetical protein|nr:DUF4388 domain-containing protein [Fibrobacterota bacterium]
MILSGELKDFSLADVLQLLLQQRKTGQLLLSRGKEKAELSIVQGNLAGVRVNGEAPESKVKDILISTGRVTKGDMSDMEAIGRDMDRSLLDTLASKGHLLEEERKEWQQIITEDLVCELFGWLEGRYEFTAGQKGMPASPLNISTEFACMEGMRRIDEWPRLREALPDAKLVFRPTGRPYDGDPQGWDYLVLGLVDSRRSVSQIARQVPFGSFRLSECIVNLWHGGFIAPVKAASEEREAPLQVDPQSEKDRKTAMVLGVSILFLVFATSVRLFAIWMTGTAGPAGPGRQVSGDYEYEITRSLARDNVETFLIDFAAHADSLPATLAPLRERGALGGREFDGSGGMPYYRRTGGFTFILK